MDRRSFLTAGSGLAASAGAGAASLARPAYAATAVQTPTVFDFGAVGDGRTDDSGAFAKAIAASYTGIGPILVPTATYLIGRTVSFTTNAHCSTPWGLVGQGATLKSAITNGGDVIQLNAGLGTDRGGTPWQARYLWLTGLNIDGTGKDGHGIEVIAEDGYKQDFYNCAFRQLVIQNMGGDGMVLNGNVFESSIDACFFEQNTNGLSCMHNYKNPKAIGVCSSISISNSYFIKNRNYGLQCGAIGATYGGCTDVTVVGGYFRGNGSYGAYWLNGMSRAMQNVGFEVNCMNLKPNDPKGAHVYAGVSANLDNCTGWNNGGGSTYLLRGYFTRPTSLTRCAHNWEGAPADQSQLGLVRIGGTSAGFVVMQQCSGNVFCESNNAAHWRAVNCSGDSPLGLLDPYGGKGTR